MYAEGTYLFFLEQFETFKQANENERATKHPIHMHL